MNGKFFIQSFNLVIASSYSGSNGGSSNQRVQSRGRI